MELTAKQLDALTHAVQNAPWAWATPYRMSDAGARASSLLALRAWLELGGYLLQTAESPTVWARFDGASDLRSGENLAALEAMECPHECGPEVERLASMPIGEALALVDAELATYGGDPAFKVPNTTRVYISFGGYSNGTPHNGREEYRPDQVEDMLDSLDTCRLLEGTARLKICRPGVPEYAGELGPALLPGGEAGFREHNRSRITAALARLEAPHAR